jgi:hypothetical protein
MTRQTAIAAFLFVLCSACATSNAARHEAVISLAEPAPGLGRDTTMPWHPDTLYEAALLHAVPGRATFNPDRSADLLAAFIERFPSDSRRRDATDRLALLNEVRSLRAELRAVKAIDLARPPR